MKGILVGVGGRARSWIETCNRHPEAELIAFVEPVEKNRQAAQEKYGLRDDQFYDKLDDALDAVSADFALDVTPPAAHEEIATTAFRAGLHVLQEKPMSDEFAAARRIVDAAEKADKTLMITQNYRYSSQPRTTRQVLDEGIIGVPELADMGFYMEWARAPGTHYTTMAYPLVKDMGIHHFDLLRYVLGREPKSVRCVTWRPSWAWHAGDDAHNLLIEFEGGLMATHHANGCSVGKHSIWNGDLRVEGPKGSITWEGGKVVYTLRVPGQDRVQEEVERPAGVTGQDGLLAEFVSAIQEGREPECSGPDNLKSLAIVFAAVESAENGGRPVEIADLFSRPF
ncbi:MAG: Gfo/Idh/MocA family oxidoreductase [Armatimonadetes bacterium]|nr:Gfo/Idh/MocA family oxidoreductase [Armatimonadota bacterium]